MRKIAIIKAALLASMLIATVIPSAWGVDASRVTWLDRYTILHDGSVEWETGHLIGVAKFQVLMSYILDPMDVRSVGIAAYEPISGQVIMIEEMFNAYKAQKLIPKWLRSQATYHIGYVSYVIVTPKGFKPVVIKTPKKLVFGVKAGKAVVLQANAQGSTPRNYQWYFNSTPFNNTNADPSYSSHWYSLFTPIPGATKSSYRISKAQTADVGSYYVVIENDLSSAQSSTFSINILPTN